MGGVGWEDATPEQRDGLGRLSAAADKRGMEISDDINAFEKEARRVLEAAEKEREAATAPFVEMEKLAEHLWDEADAIEFEIIDTPARTMEGVIVKAELLAEHRKYGDTLVDNRDGRLAKTLLADLKRIAAN